MSITIKRMSYSLVAGIPLTLKIISSSACLRREKGISLPTVIRNNEQPDNITAHSGKKLDNNPLAAIEFRDFSSNR